MRYIARRSTLVLIFLLALGCGGDGGPSDPGNDTGPVAGSIQVAVTTAGDDLPGVYSLMLDGVEVAQVAATGGITIPEVTAGLYSVGITPVPAHCSVDGTNPVRVSVIGGSVSQVVFTVQCIVEEPPPLGAIAVTTVTTGDNPDADGYTVTLNGITVGNIGVNDQLVIPNLSAGTYELGIIDVIADCSVSGDNPRSVAVPEGGQAQIDFVVSCNERTGDLQVNTVTSGPDPDVDGYTVTLDANTAQTVVTNGSVLFRHLSIGPHSVGLSGLASQCRVSGANPLTINVQEGATVQAVFSVICRFLEFPYVYVSESGGVIFVDRLTNSIETTVGVAYEALGTALAPDGRYLYVATAISNEIAVVDTEQRRLVGRWPTCNRPTGIAVHPTGDRVYVACRDGNTIGVWETDNSSNASVRVGEGPIAVALTPDGRWAYFTNSVSGTVSVVDTQGDYEFASIPVGGTPVAVASSPLAGTMYVVRSDSGELLELSTTSNLVVRRVVVGSLPNEVAILPNGSRAYVTDQVTNRVAVVSLSSLQVIAHVNVGSLPSGVATSPDGEFVYVTNRDGRTLSVISAASNTVVATVSLGSMPQKVTARPLP